MAWQKTAAAAELGSIITMEEGPLSPKQLCMEEKEEEKGEIRKGLELPEVPYDFTDFEMMASTRRMKAFTLNEDDDLPRPFPKGDDDEYFGLPIGEVSHPAEIFGGEKPERMEEEEGAITEGMYVC
jgi:hypothetical protein